MAKKFNKEKIEEKLRNIYNEAVILSQKEKITPEMLSKRFNLTIMGGICVYYMLSVGEYCPALEILSQTKESVRLKRRIESESKIIEFYEDMPPYKKSILYNKEISDKDKEIYVKAGLANYLTFNDCRLQEARICDQLVRYCDQKRFDILEAIANKDIEFLKRFFNNSKEEQIIKYMNTGEKYTKEQIDTLLKLLSTKISEF